MPHQDVSVATRFPTVSYENLLLLFLASLWIPRIAAHLPLSIEAFCFCCFMTHLGKIRAVLWADFNRKQKELSLCFWEGYQGGFTSACVFAYSGFGKCNSRAKTFLVYQDRQQHTVQHWALDALSLMSSLVEQYQPFNVLAFSPASLHNNV